MMLGWSYDESDRMRACHIFEDLDFVLEHLLLFRRNVLLPQHLARALRLRLLVQHNSHLAKSAWTITLVVQRTFAQLSTDSVVVAQFSDVLDNEVSAWHAGKHVRKHSALTFDLDVASSFLHLFF